MPNHREFGVIPEELAQKLARRLIAPDQRFVVSHAKNLIREQGLTEGELAYLVVVAAEAILKAGTA